MLGERLTPGIPMKLLRLDGRMTPQLYGLVDSGADCSLFPGAWAPLLGIDLREDCSRAHGRDAGGTSLRYFYEPGIDAIIMERKIHLRAVFADRTPVVLLGREDFFQHFKVSFDQRGLTFTAEAYE